MLYENDAAFGAFLNQPRCNRLAKFLAWIRMLRINKGQSDGSVPGPEQTCKQLINKATNQCMNTQARRQCPFPGGSGSIWSKACHQPQSEPSQPHTASANLCIRNPSPEAIRVLPSKPDRQTHTCMRALRILACCRRVFEAPQPRTRRSLR